MNPADWSAQVLPTQQQLVRTCMNTHTRKHEPGKTQMVLLGEPVRTRMAQRDKDKHGTGEPSDVCTYRPWHKCHGGYH